MLEKREKRRDKKIRLFVGVIGEKKRQRNFTPGRRESLRLRQGKKRKREVCCWTVNKSSPWGKNQGKIKKVPYRGGEGKEKESRALGSERKKRERMRLSRIGNHPHRGGVSDEKEGGAPFAKERRGKHAGKKKRGRLSPRTFLPWGREKKVDKGRCFVAKRKRPDLRKRKKGEKPFLKEDSLKRILPGRGKGPGVQ